MEKRKRALLMYLFPRTWAYLGGAFALILGIACLRVAANPVGGFVLFLVMAGVVMFSPCRKIYQAISNVRELENRGRLEQALDEFESGRSLADDGLRMGEQFVFGKGSGTVVEYKDIAQLYERVHKTNFVEDERGLMMVMRYGGAFKLCSLPKGGLDKAAMMEIYMLFLVKNPEIKIGYR